MALNDSLLCADKWVILGVADMQTDISKFAAFLALSEAHDNQSDKHTVLLECTMSSSKSSDICKA